jgi:hypothetical protein
MKWGAALWFILYWPIMGALIFVGNRLDKRYAAGSVQRERADMALGCAILAMPGVPLVWAVGWIFMHNPTEPPILVIEAIIAFNLALALFFGGLRVCPGTSNGITEFSEHEAD